MYNFDVNKFLEECAICPITHNVMKNPVVAADGQSYEKEAIEEWFERGNRTSPATGANLVNLILIPNYTLRSMIEGLQDVAHPQPSAPPQEEDDEPKVIQPCQKQNSLKTRKNVVNVFVYGAGVQSMAVLHTLRELKLPGLNLLYCFNPGQINPACYKQALQAADHILLPLDLSNDPDRYSRYAKELRSLLPGRSFTQKVLTINVAKTVVTGNNNRFDFFRAQRLPQPQQADLHSLRDMQEYITEIVNKRAAVPHPLEVRPQ